MCPLQTSVSLRPAHNYTSFGEGGKLVHFKLASASALVAFLFGSCPAAKAELMIVFHFTLARSFSVYHRLNELSAMLPHSCGYYALKRSLQGVESGESVEWRILKCSFDFDLQHTFSSLNGCKVSCFTRWCLCCLLPMSGHR